MVRRRVVIKSLKRLLGFTRCVLPNFKLIEAHDDVTHMISFTRISHFSCAMLKSWEEPGYEAN